MNIKILILGGPESGKSSFLNRYIYQIYSDKHVLTQNIHYGEKSINNKQKIELGLWDISSKELSNPYHRVYYYGAEVALVLVDVANSTSFDDAIIWKKTLEKGLCCTKIILIYNKCDLPNNQWIMSKEELRVFAKENGFDDSFIISVKQNKGINKVMDYVISHGKKVKQKREISKSDNF